MPLLPPDPVFILKGDMGYVHALTFAQEANFSRHLLASCENGYVYIWDLEVSDYVMVYLCFEFCTSGFMITIELTAIELH